MVGWAKYGPDWGRREPDGKCSAEAVARGLPAGTLSAQGPPHHLRTEPTLKDGSPPPRPDPSPRARWVPEGEEDEDAGRIGGI